MNAPTVKGEAAQALTTAQRRAFLGGSDAAAVLGVSPWTTPLELFLEKTGKAAPTEADAARERIYARGKRLEPVIIEMTVDKLRDLGLRVEVVAHNLRYVDDAHPFLRCEIDFEVRLWGRVWIENEWVELDGEHVNGDAKSVNHFAAGAWGIEHSEDVPTYYAAQFMHGLGITGRRFCLVGALKSLDDVEIYWVRRDEETVQAMREKLVRFWTSNVLLEVPPDPITFADVRTLFPRDDGTGMQADQDLLELVELLRAAKADKKDAEERETGLQFAVAEAMGARSAVLQGGKVLATFKAQTDGRRVLRLVEPRKKKA